MSSTEIREYVVWYVNAWVGIMATGIEEDSVGSLPRASPSSAMAANRWLVLEATAIVWIAVAVCTAGGIKRPDGVRDGGWWRNSERDGTAHAKYSPRISPGVSSGTG